MKKIFGAFVITGALLATPAFAQVASSTDATSTAPTSGGHATEAQMQVLLSPADYSVYLAQKNQVSVMAPKAADQASLIQQIIALLKQEIATMTN